MVANPSIAGNAVIIADQGHGGRVPSQLYHDLFASYSFGENFVGSRQRGGFLSRLEVAFGARNIFNKAPPVDLSNASYYSYFGDVRIGRYYVSVRGSF